ncbi:hypothetical protein LTR66_003863 [Elasticomyces elasticus]|nr:hypothetical protein LTR28_010177 [Elasticomyces elasticus]KAK4996559.1 hypothetical protein LTR66_003863 [Elasticomyces elasticus]
MNTLSEDVLTRVSTEAAETFADAYYTSLTSSRSTLSTFYAPQTTLPNGKLLPTILWNGTSIPTPTAFQSLFAAESMPYTYFEVQSLNAHVLNPSLEPIDDDRAGKNKIENNISVLVQVSGYVRLIERKEGPMRGFSDTLVLVPNREGTRGKSSVGRRWVVQSQNLRFVV